MIWSQFENQFPRLTAPYGWPKGRGFFLFVQPGVTLDHQKVADLLKDFGCWPPPSPRSCRALSIAAATSAGSRTRPPPRSTSAPCCSPT